MKMVAADAVSNSGWRTHTRELYFDYIDTDGATRTL